MYIKQWVIPRVDFSQKFEISTKVIFSGESNQFRKRVQKIHLEAEQT